MNLRTIVSAEISRKHLQCLMALEHKLFQPHHAASLDSILRWHNQNPETYIILVNQNNEVVGYSDTIAIKQETLDNFLSGKITEANILASGPAQFTQPGIFQFYISCAAIHPSYQNSGGMLMLRQAMYDRIHRIKKQGIIITHILAEAISLEGEKCLKADHFEVKAKSPTGNPIYLKTLVQDGVAQMDAPINMRKAG